MALVLNPSDTLRPAREHHGAGGATHAASYLPSPALARCVRACLVRRTHEATAGPVPALGWNHFPPTPTCVLVWVLEGHDSRLAEAGLAPRRRGGPAPVLFAGPFLQPSMSWNEGPAHFFTLLLYPDAWHALTGRPVQAHVGRYCDFRQLAGELADASWRALAHEVGEAPDDAARMRLIEAFLAPRWARVWGATRAPVAAPGIADWARVLGQRAHAPGGSERQVERRIRQWTGQNLRQLRGLGRMEQALLRLNDPGARAVPAWPELALEQGFADQAHLCREFRRHLGLTPRQARAQLQQDAGWVLRVWA